MAHLAGLLGFLSKTLFPEGSYYPSEPFFAVPRLGYTTKTKSPWHKRSPHILVRSSHHLTIVKPPVEIDCRIDAPQLFAAFLSTVTVMTISAPTRNVS